MPGRAYHLAPGMRGGQSRLRPSRLCQPQGNCFDHGFRGRGGRISRRYENGCRSPSSKDRDPGKAGPVRFDGGHGVLAIQSGRRAGRGLETRSAPRGGTLAELGYEPLARLKDGSIASEVLGLDVGVDDRPELEDLLRFRNPRSGEDRLTLRGRKRAGQRRSESGGRQNGSSERRVQPDRDRRVR